MHLYVRYCQAGLQRAAWIHIYQKYKYKIIHSHGTRLHRSRNIILGHDSVSRDSQTQNRVFARPSLKKQSTTINNAVAGQQILPFLVFSRCSRAQTGNMIGNTGKKGAAKFAGQQNSSRSESIAAAFLSAPRKRPVPSRASPPLHYCSPHSFPPPFPISAQPDRKKWSQSQHGAAVVGGGMAAAWMGR